MEITLKELLGGIQYEEPKFSPQELAKRARIKGLDEFERMLETAIPGGEVLSFIDYPRTHSDIGAIVQETSIDVYLDGRCVWKRTFFDRTPISYEEDGRCIRGEIERDEAWNKINLDNFQQYSFYVG